MWQSLWLVLLAIVFHAAGSRAELKPQLDMSVVRIMNVRGDKVSTGSGFVLDQEGYVATNNHVIAGGGDIKVPVVGDQTNGFLEAKVIWSSKEKDLAVIKVKGLERPPAVLYDGEVVKGEKLYAIGFPGVADQLGGMENITESTVSEGVLGRIISASWGSEGDKFPIIQHSVQLNPGNSGGPLFNEYGQVVGINTAISRDDIAADPQAASGVRLQVAQGINYSSHIQNFIEELAAREIPFTASHDRGASAQANGPGAFGSWPKLLLASLPGVLMAAYISRRKNRDAIRAYTEHYSRKLRPDVRKGLGGKGGAWSLEEASGQGCIDLPLPLLSSRAGLVLGRDGNICDLEFSHSSLSRRQCRLMLHEGKLYVEELNSKNGTRVAGVPVRPFVPTPLRDGDELHLGQELRTRVRYR